MIKRQENTGVRKILYERQGLLLVLEWLPPRRSIPGTPLASLHPGKGGHYKLPERVEAAHQAIRQYLIQKGRTLSAEERDEIDDALRTLVTLIQRRAA